MKTLSLLQPWATLVAIGAKKIETRSWYTGHRGELLIHASSGKAGELICKEEPFNKYISDFNALPFGAIIGKVTLVDVVRIEQLELSNSRINQLSLEERAFGDYTLGRYAWLLEDATEFEKPIPVKGSLRLWDFNL
ncbi:MAG: ASCH domain-containing protein [Chitinophagaceae bacterium]|nr:ASCH domain-containing protein [Chitinophagaceae bacterium]